MNTTRTTSSTGTSLRVLLMLLFVPALVFLTGCDSGGSGGGGNDGIGTGADAERTEAGNAGETETTVGVDYNNDGTDEVVRVTDVDGQGIAPDDADDQTVTWTPDKTYELNGFVFVNPDETLIIEPGTEIQGRLGGGSDASALIVASGGEIQAKGEKDDPIVFTSVRAADGSLDSDDRGLWGGVILLGDAPTNNATQETNIEGVPDDTGSRIEYGGSDPNHSVGTFKYVSIRHTGTQLGNGDEIQGLTLGGVGAGSTIEYVESYASADDGFEWFGGTVNTKYLIAAFVSDDNFDIDQGYRGSNQFWLAVQGDNQAGRASEMDGAGDAGSKPIAQSIIANATYIGMGPALTDDEVSGDANDPFIIHRDDNATSYYNSIFTGGRTNAGIQLEDIDGTQDASDRWDSGTLEHVSNTWYNIGPDYSGASSPTDSDFEQLVQVTRNNEDNNNATGDRGEDLIADLASYMNDNDHQLATSAPLVDITRDDNGEIQSFDPSTASTVDGASTVSDFGAESSGVNDNADPVNERGAFASNANWNLDGWTKIVAQGELTGQ